MPMFHNLDGTTRNEFQIGKSGQVRVRNNAGIMEFTNDSGATWTPFATKNLDSILTATREPTGFDRPESVLRSYNSTNRQVTLTGAGWQAMFRGTVIPTLTNGFVSTAHPATLDHTYFLYHDGNDFAWATDTFPGFDKVLIASVAYYTNWKRCIPEVHGLSMDGDTHREVHYNIGTWKETGGTVSGITLLSTTAADRRPDVAAATLWDEDVPTINPALTSKLYTQRSLTTTGVRTFAFSAADIVALSGNNPYYNQYTGGNFVQTLMPANSHMTVWVFAVPVTTDADSQRHRLEFVQGQAVTTATSGNAGALTTSYNAELQRNSAEVNLGEPASPRSEYVAIHKFILQYTGGNWTIRGSIALTGSQAMQVGAPTGQYLSQVVTDTTLTGDGTPGNPLSVVGGSGGGSWLTWVGV
jgi:hypothetical protein